ncbi:MAG: hypothetical protein ACAH95_13175 [Fimbriimonas sp.]
MVLNNFIGLVLLATTLAPAQISFDPTRDPGPKPIAVVPDSYTIGSNQGVGVTITMDQTVTSNTTVYVSSSHPSILAAPSYVTVLSGNSTARLQVVSSSAPSAKGRSTTVRLTAWTADGSAYADVVVN